MKNPPQIKNGDQVRVTIVGPAHPFDGHYLGVGGRCNFVDLESDHVKSVEYLIPTRTWTDGDVVQHDIGSGFQTRTRRYGQWNGVPFLWSDERINKMLADSDEGTARVLRYQAGGDE